MKILTTLLVSVGLLVLAAGAALAHSGSDAYLKISPSESGVEGWTTDCTDWIWGCPAVGGSPRDAGNSWAVYAGQGEPYDVINLYNGTSGIKSKSVANVKNLSFEWSGYVDQGRAPRIQVNFTNGGYAMLSHAYCSRAISGNWKRSDFTGQKAVDGQSCGIWMHSYTGVWDFYPATATRSAWASLAKAKPGLVVKNAFWTLDVDWECCGLPEGPPGAVDGGGEIYTVLIDRLAIQNHMWTAPTTVKHCTTEASC